MHPQDSITMPEETVPERGLKSVKETVIASDDPIGKALRRLHDEVVAEPIPEEFLRLLGEIERKLNGAVTPE
jgi:hypothetical protein